MAEDSEASKGVILAAVIAAEGELASLADRVIRRTPYLKINGNMLKMYVGEPDSQEGSSITCPIYVKKAGTSSRTPKSTLPAGNPGPEIYSGEEIVVSSIEVTAPSKDVLRESVLEALAAAAHAESFG